MPVAIEVYSAERDDNKIHVKAAFYYNVPAGKEVPDLNKEPLAGASSRLPEQQKAALKSGAVIEIPQVLQAVNMTGAEAQDKLLERYALMQPGAEFFELRKGEQDFKDAVKTRIYDGNSWS